MFWPRQCGDKVLDRLGLGAADRLVEVAADPLQRAGSACGAVYALEAETEAGVHDLEQTEIDRRVLLGAVKLVEKPHAAHPLVEEADQHAVLRPDLAVLARQVLHNVVGAGGERVFRGFDLVGRRAAGARVDLELLNGLRDLIHELARAGARQRRPQPAEQQAGATRPRA